mgnify:CR=1 FL=1
MNVKPQLWGALCGALLGVSWLIWDWRFLWIAVFVAAGALVGWVLAYRGELGRKLREVLRVMSR